MEKVKGTLKKIAEKVEQWEIEWLIINNPYAEQVEKKWKDKKVEEINLIWSELWNEEKNIIANMKNLKIFWLLNQDVEEDNLKAIIKELVNLEELYLSWNKLWSKDIVFILSLEKLKVLDVSCNNIWIHWLVKIWELKSLEELYIDQNPITDGFEYIANLKNLRVLSARWCGLESIQWVEKLEKLEVLDLMWNLLDDEEVERLLKLKNLKEVNLRHNKISAEMKKKLKDKWLTHFITWLTINDLKKNLGKAWEAIEKMFEIAWITISPEEELAIMNPKLGMHDCIYYNKYKWTEKQKEEFEKWLFDKLYNDKEYRKWIMKSPTNNKRTIEKIVNWFVLEYWLSYSD